MYFPQQRASSFTERPYLISCSNPHKNSAVHTRGSLRWLHKWSQSQGNSSCFPSFSEHRDSACSLLLSAILFCVILAPLRLTAELTINSLPLASPFFITSKNKYVGILLQCLLLITIEKQKITKLNIGLYHFTVVVSNLYSSWLPLWDGKLNALASALQFYSQGCGSSKVLPFFVEASLLKT